MGRASSKSRRGTVSQMGRREHSRAGASPLVLSEKTSGRLGEECKSMNITVLTLQEEEKLDGDSVGANSIGKVFRCVVNDGVCDDGDYELLADASVLDDKEPAVSEDDIFHPFLKILLAGVALTISATIQAARMKAVGALSLACLSIFQFWEGVAGAGKSWDMAHHEHDDTKIRAILVLV